MIELQRYFLVSIVALGVDLAVLLLAASVMHYLWAASLGFVLGAVTSYLLAVKWVFQHRRFAARPKTEFGAYAMIGIMGLGINNIVIFAAVESIGVPLGLAKVGAAILTFAFNFGLRKRRLFQS